MSSTVMAPEPSEAQCRIIRMGKHAIVIGAVGHIVADRLGSRRADLGITQTDLALIVTEAGRRMGRQAIAEIETRQRRVDVDDVAVLAAVLDTTTAYLMGELDDPNQKYTPARRR